jgi:type IV pilus assembly protein PilB
LAGSDGGAYHGGVSSDRSPPGQEPKAPRVPIGELLVQAKVLSREQLEQALLVPREPGKKLGQTLIERGWVSEAQLTQTLSLQLSVPWVSLYHIDFSRQLLNRVSRELADRHCLIPIFVRHVKGHGETLYVAMDDPTNEVALAEVAGLAGLPAKPMIASASDIRSAIRVYYGEPATANVIEVPIPAVRPDALPMTMREGRPPPPAPPASAAPSTQPDASPRGANPSAPPPPPPARPSQPAPPARTSQPPARPSAPPARPSQPAAKRTSSAPPPAPAAAAPAAPAEGAARRRPGKMISLTLLDGTTIGLPSRPAGGRKSTFASQEGLTARDFITALRAASHGADATEILGEKPQWEPVIAAVLSILLKKGLIADWELVEELRKI